MQSPILLTGNSISTEHWFEKNELVLTCTHNAIQLSGYMQSYHGHNYYKLVKGIQKLLCFSQTETHKKQKSLFQFTNSHFLFQCCHYLNQQQWLKGIAVININHKGLSLLTISHHCFPSGSLNMLSFFLLAGKMENEWQKH